MTKSEDLTPFFGWFEAEHFMSKRLKKLRLKVMLRRQDTSTAKLNADIKSLVFHGRSGEALALGFPVWAMLILVSIDEIWSQCPGSDFTAKITNQIEKILWAFNYCSMLDQINLYCVDQPVKIGLLKGSARL